MQGARLALLVLCLLTILLPPGIFAQNIPEADTYASILSELRAAYLSAVMEEPLPEQGDFRLWPKLILDLTKDLGAPENSAILLPGEFHSFEHNLLYRVGGSAMASGDFEDMLGGLQDRILLVLPLPGPSLESSPDFEDSFEYRLAHYAAALHILRQLSLSPPAIPTDILFLGAEYEQQKGLRVFLSSPESIAYRAAFWVGSFGNSESWELTSGTRGQVSPGWMLRDSLSILRARGIRPEVSNFQIQLHRMGLSEATAIDAMLRAEIPTLMFGNSRMSNASMIWQTRPMDQTGEAGAPDNEQILSRAMAILDLLHSAALRDFSDTGSNWERHYVLVQFGSALAELGEFPYLLIVFAAVTVTLVWLRSSRHRRRRYARLLGRFGLAIVGLFFASFLALLAGGLLPELVLLLQGSSTIWRLAPIPFFILKVLGGIALAGWLYRTIEALIPSQDGSVFTAAAVVTLLLDVLILAVINVSLVYYYLWALIFTMLFAVTRQRYLKLFWFLLSPFWILKSFTELFDSSNPGILEALIRVRPETDLLLAFLVLPYLAMMLRLDILFRKPEPELKAKRHRFRIRPLESILAVSTLGLFLGLSFFQASEGRPQLLDLSLSESGSGSNLQIQSELRLPEGRLELRQYDIELAGQGNALEQELPILLPSADWATESSHFLNRTTWDGYLRLPENTVRASISLSIQGNPIVYDLNLPFSIDQEAGRIALYLGDFPESLIPFHLVLPRDSNPQMEIRITSFLTGKDMVWQGKAVQFRASQEAISRAPL